MDVQVRDIGRLTAPPEGNSGPTTSVKKRNPFDLDYLISAIRRQYKPWLVCVGLAVTLGLIYLLTAVPQYTASTKVLIDSAQSDDKLSATIAQLTLDTSAIDSQVEVIKSDNVTAQVIKILKLDQDPEFLQSGGFGLGAWLRSISQFLDLRSWFVTREIPPEEIKDAKFRAISTVLSNNVDVKRVNRTYVLNVEYTSPNPTRAMQISNAFAEAYFNDQLEAKYDATRRASGWLSDRITELKDKSLVADLAVQRFKAANGLISIDGKLVGDQQMSEMTTQLSAAHSDTAKAEARLQQITDIINSGRMDGAVTETLGSPIVNELRGKYLQAEKSAGELTAKLGPKHYQVLSLRAEMQQYEALIFSELQRVAQTYASEVAIAKSKEKSANESLATQVGQKAVSNEIMVQLRELDRESETYKNLYQSFLQRYQDAIQRQSFPVTEARIITPAAYPISPSKPNRLLTLAFAMALGMLFGIVLAALREYRDRAFRIASQVREELGLQVIGMLPTVKLKETVSAKSVDAAARNPRELVLDRQILRHSIDAPLSAFSEILRGAKVEIDVALGRNTGGHVIGFVSVLPNEGKTTTAKNFASLLAFLGSKILLIDGDIRNPGLTKSVARHANRGLLEVLRGDEKLEDCLLVEAQSNLTVLPAVIRKRIFQSSDLLASKEMENLLAQARKDYDYVIVDLPPVGPVIDVRAASFMYDGFIFIIEWGKTARSVVANALRDDDALYEKCIGVIMNKVETEKFKLYNSYGAKDYYYSRYGKYYVDAGKANSK